MPSTMTDDQRQQQQSSDDNGSGDDGSLPADVTAAIGVLKAAAKTHGEAIAEAFVGTPLYQIPSAAGHRAGSAKATKTLQSANERIAQLEAEIADAQGKAPDVERIKQAYERQLSKKDEERAALETQLSALDATVREEKLGAALSKVLRPTAARLMQKELAARVRRTADGRDWELLDPDSPDVVVRLPKGRSAFDVLAEEAKGRPDIEPEDVLAAAQSSGGGRSNGTPVTTRANGAGRPGAGKAADPPIPVPQF